MRNLPCLGGLRSRATECAHDARDELEPWSVPCYPFLELARDDRRLPIGLYDRVVTESLSAALAELPDELKELGPLEGADAPHALARLLHDRIVHALAGLPSKDRIGHQVRLVNDVLELVSARAARGTVESGDRLASQAQRLQAILQPAVGPAVAKAPPRPQIPLSSSDLLVNGRHDPSIGPEVVKELASADRVDLLCSFLKWSGFRLVQDALREFVDRNGGGALRVLTTAYMSATQRRALDALVEMGAQLRVSYDTSRTRLHAKAWLFHRDSGFTTAYVGSSNLSHAAMVDGLEWNVRLSAVDNGAIVDKFEAAFGQYWDDVDFRAYDAVEFDEAVTRQKRAGLAPYLRFDITARPHQQEILDELEAERARGHCRNLVVAATGTGKTIVAALDYKRLRRSMGRDRLLFVAHRRQIIDQSHTTFQVVLADGAFGEALYSGEVPSTWDHVFANVQSLNADRLLQFDRDHFDVIIVDEFHHAAASSKTYASLLAHFQPKYLIGLTATPERADGQTVLDWFDGRIGSELRLWKALDPGLLSPFQYFGVGGAPDLRGVKWSRGQYDTKTLSNVYTADHLFAKRVIQQVHAKVADPLAMRALGFCVDVAHARFMADRFNEAGIGAAAVWADTPQAERQAKWQALRGGELQCLFSVNLFNEGVDLPDVDVVLFLRPTESATVFLQQLGRGLRRSEDKECLTVLDFIGHAHRKFRFDARYRAIVGGTRHSIKQQVERGFPALPSGCIIQLDRQSERAVLENIEQVLRQGGRAQADDLRALGDVDMSTFLADAGLELEDVYAKEGRCWTRLRRDAGLLTASRGDDDDQIERGLARMLHLDDPFRLQGIRALVSPDSPPRADDQDPLQRWLFALLGYVRRPLTDLANVWKTLWQSPALREEIRQLTLLLEDRTRHLTHPYAGTPLYVHATYTLDEILTGLDERNKKGGIKRVQTGVYYSVAHDADALFVTLEKLDKDYSPTTRYRDYPISATRFHWETQGNCHPATPTGRRYLNAERGAKGRVLLFVRLRKSDERGITMPYVFLGPAYCDTHRSERPVQIEWLLDQPMPASFFQEAKVAAG